MLIIFSPYNRFYNSSTQFLANALRFSASYSPGDTPEDCLQNSAERNVYNSLGEGGMGNCESGELGEVHVPTLGRLGAVQELKMVNYVWQRDYQGLYDYDSREVARETYAISKHALVLLGRERKTVQEVGEGSLDEELLKSAAFEVVRRANYYKIVPIYIDNEQYTLQKLLWLVVKTVPHHRYPLRERDIIKFGKQKIKIREIVLNDHNPSALIEAPVRTEKKVYDDLKLHPEQPPKEGKEMMRMEEAEVQSIATENEVTCRICLQGGEQGNPLICPCKCTGSVRYIHLQCLRTWLGKQLNVVRSRFCVSIKWTPLSCEMCKTHYRYRIYLDNKKYYTVEIPKPGRPYIVLEVMKRSAHYSKIFHFVSLAETTKVSIGRKKEIDVKISDDISVSRHHANLIYDFENRTFLLEDNKSKFGTLVLVKKNLLVGPNNRGLAFQMGGEIFAFDTQRAEGPIPDYYDEEQYLNANERGERQQQEEDSEEENNEEFEDEEEEDEAIPTNVNLNLHPPAHNPSSEASPLLLLPAPPRPQPAQNPSIVLSSAENGVVEELDS